MGNEYCIRTFSSLRPFLFESLALNMVSRKEWIYMQARLRKVAQTRKAEEVRLKVEDCPFPVGNAVQ